MLLYPLLRPCCADSWSACGAAVHALNSLKKDVFLITAAKMSSKQARSFRTQAMPSTSAVMGASGFASTSSFGPSTQDAQSYRFSLDQRSTSSLGCSTSGASCSSNSSSYAMLQQSNRLRFSRRRLPFASISSEQLGSVGQLRWLSSGSSSRPGRTDPQQQQQQSVVPGIHPNMTEAEILAAAKAATAPDTFKAGDILASGRYQLLHKLGEGADGVAEGFGEGRFTTLWLGVDCHANQQVVLKLVEAGDSVSYTAGTREAALHAMAGRHPNLLALLDAFEHRSKAGRHACMVLEKAGSNLDVVIETWRRGSTGKLRNDCLFSSPQGVAAVKNIARQLLTALRHLHSRGIVHMDLSTDNILIDRPFISVLYALASHKGVSKLQVLGHAMNAYWFKSHKSLQTLNELTHHATQQRQHFYTSETLQHATVKLTDFGRAVPYKQHQQLLLPDQQRALMPATAQQHAVDWTRDGPVVMGDPGLRPPEEILAMEYVAPAYDIWRAACVLFELALGFPLFDVNDWAMMRRKHPRAKAYSDDAIHLMEMQALIGYLPREFIRRSPIFDRLFFKHNDSLRLSNVYELVPGFVTVNKLVQKQTLGLADAEQAHQFSDFIRKMLVCDPVNRPSAEQMLQHKFLQPGDNEQQQQQARFFGVKGMK